LSVRNALIGAIVLALGAGGCEGGEDPKQEATGRPVTVNAAQPAGRQAGVTPMAQRVAVLGLLNKRNGIVRDIPLRPGQSVRVKDVIVRLRACETTPPWENEVLTGAFVQVDVERTDGNWQRIFSGWLYKESPSLNVVEHPVYDVWPKSCAMTYPAGPGVPAAPVASSSRSSARKSGGAAAARRDSDAPTPEPAEEAAPPATPPPAAPPPPSAADNNAT
jgi:hypothetical protein